MPLVTTLSHIGRAEGLAISVGFTATFIGGLYAVGTGISRDDPTYLIKRAFAAVTATLACGAYVYFRAHETGGLESTIADAISATGAFATAAAVTDVSPSVGNLRPDVIATATSSFSELVGLQTPAAGILRTVGPPLLLTAALYAGDLARMMLVEVPSGITSGRVREQLLTYEDRLCALRDYISAPITEELVFRSFMVAVLAPAWGHRGAAWLAPVLFGTAHLHHLAGGQHGLNSALVQMAFTTVFGWYTAHLLVSTRSILGPIACHCFCNLMGLPDLEASQRAPPKYKGALMATHYAGLAAFLYGLPHVFDAAMYIPPQ